MFEVREPAADERAAWEELFRGYLSVYERDEPQATYDRAWTALRERPSMHVWVVVEEGALLGLVHVIVHPSTSSADVCYLQDLFTAPAARGRGLGRALIDHVVAWAREQGCARVYWQTREANATARILYDSLAELTDFCVYRIPL